jgi:phosphatidylinositol alpha-1,6-mannosyltransferase
MVRRKGQDTLVRAWPSVLESVPTARLLLVGDGPYRSALEGLVDRLGVRSAVTLTGSVPWQEMPGYTEAGDVFAMPCRARLLGLEVEAFGIVFLEAAACGLPVVVGDSGGAPETVIDGDTGFVVRPNSVHDVAARVVELLVDRASAAEMGVRGVTEMAATRTWGASVAVLSRLLSDDR